MKIQVKHCHDDAKATGGNITLNQKLYLPIRSLTKAIISRLTATEGLVSVCLNQKRWWLLWECWIIYQPLWHILTPLFLNLVKEKLFIFCKHVKSPACELSTSAFKPNVNKEYNSANLEVKHWRYEGTICHHRTKTLQQGFLNSWTAAGVFQKTHFQW